jgi:hypothetical protein
MGSEPASFPEHLRTALLRLVDTLQSRKIAYALIGGLATGYRARPRFTQDIDVVLHIPQLILPRLLEDLRDEGFEFDLTAVIREWNQEHMTALTYQGVQVDWLKAIIPLYQRVIDMAKPEDWSGHCIRVATPESLIVTKLVSFRRQDQVDIENLLAANQGELDVAFIRSEWRSVAAADDPRSAQFDQMLKQFYRSGLGE